MSSAEFAEWQAFDRLEPLGTPHVDRLFQRLCWVIFNAARMSSQHKIEPMDEEKFAFEWWRAPEEDSAGAEGTLDSKIRGIMGMMG